MIAVMLENIRRIGIFMIAAQTVIHFAAGKQYEKNMKIIAGVIVLIQFIGTFVSSSAEITAGWQEQARQMTEWIESRNEMWREVEYAAGSAEQLAVRQIEDEIRMRFNGMISDKDSRVTDVIVEMEEDEDSGEWIFQRVRVRMYFGTGDGDGPVWESFDEKADSRDVQDEKICVEEIRIGDIKEGASGGQDKEQDAASDRRAETYQNLFAQALGIEQERVEVIWLGGG